MILNSRSPSDVRAFQNHYSTLHARAYHRDLWGAAYIISGGCSDDGFHYFRDWLISEGQATYEAALADPESLAGLTLPEVCENESYGYVAGEVYEELTGSEMDLEPHAGPSDPIGDPWDEDELYDRFPVLAAKYG